MRILKLTLINIKRQLKNPLMIIMGVLLPVALLITINSDMIGVSNNIKVFNGDNSKESEVLIEKMKEDFEAEDILMENIKEEIEGVKEGKVSTLFIIHEGFGEDLKNGTIPNIWAYRGGEGVGNLGIDKTIESFIKENINNEDIREAEKNYIKTELLKEETVKKGSMEMSVVMICYFMMIGGSFIVEELIKFKKAQVLRRAVASPSRDIEVIGSLLLSSFLIQGFLAVIAFKIVQIVLKFEGVNIGLVILAIFLGSLMSNSIMLAIVRWVKNEGVATLMIVLIALIAFILGILSSNIGMIENPPAFFKLGILSHFLWMFKIVEGEGVLIATVIVILMAILLLTFGSFKIRDFVKE
ncbi:MAG: ABC transporter permease [Clostridium sp.]